MLILVYLLYWIDFFHSINTSEIACFNSDSVMCRFDSFWLLAILFWTKEIISSTEDLDIIIEDYIRATGVASNHYRNVTPSETKTLPSITGIIYIDNSDENAEAISETSLQDHYKQYFPDLKIYAAKVTESYISKFVQDLGNGIEEEVDLIRKEGMELAATAIIESKRAG